LIGSPRDYDALLDMVGETRFVLLGEASHGTHEFYRERAKITKRLICEKGFSAVAVESDWPDAYRVNRFVRGEGGDLEAVDALTGFQRFPQWMWRNADVLDFVGWLRSRNDPQESAERKVGFYGLDLYSLHASIEAVLAYLAKQDPSAATRARKRYACFDHNGKNTQSDGLAAGLGIQPTCEDEVINELVELRLSESSFLQNDGRAAADEFYCAEQNALVIKNTEQYYRTMFRA
jgi:erythromycin esterase-like protein